MSRYSIVFAAVLFSFGVMAVGLSPTDPGGEWTLDARAVCGDGIIETGEECDDGNTDAGDGCSSSCAVEANHTCIAEPSTCGPDCNDDDLPDECDLDCTALDGACNVPDCGFSDDFNSDARPDECGVIDDCLFDYITFPAALNTNAASDSGHDLNPQLATDGQGYWLAVWHSSDDLGGTIGTDYDIFFSTSTNNGASWTGPEPLNTNAASDAGTDAHPQLATDGQGNWMAVWESTEDLGGTIGTDGDILFSNSTDNEVSWTDPAPLNTNAASDSAWDWEPQLATVGQGNWLAVWFSDDELGGTIGADSDILFSRFRSIGEDCNCNAVPDQCEGGTGDTDGDGVVSLMDYSAIADCMTGPCQLGPCVPALYADLCCLLVDMDEDGDIDLADFARFQIALTAP
ncbi:MAG: DUF4215 domain-containing protein [Phycisphaerales bacterium]|nr:MAG: DUF4215 domain-containing protein [Phycisphaerales bacterium]